MAEVFAGFVIGYALSLAAAPIAAIALIRSNDRTGIAQRIAPPGTSAIALSVVLHFAAVLLLTALGIVLGLMLGGLEHRRPDGGLGSPNLIYTLIVLALTVIITLPAMIVPAIRTYAAIGAVVVAVSFGWLMPWLATLG